MNTIRYYLLTAAVLLSFCLVMRAQIAPLPADSSEATTQTVPIAISNRDDAATTSAEPPAWAQMRNPFEQFGQFVQRTAGDDSGAPFGRPADLAAPAAYPAAGSSASNSDPTHFEIEGFVQWRNLSNSANVSTANQGNISLSKDLGIGKQAAGPLFRFIWTPDRKIWGASSKIWVEYGQIDRSHTVTTDRTFTFDGRIFAVNSTLKAELNTKQFELGYAPRWGNDKFKIGPSVTYEHLGVEFILTDLTPGAPPPIKKDVNVPNNLVLIGADFDYTPVERFDAYAKLGVVPCCGGGWHVFESEFGAKYYFLRSVSVLGGIRYQYFRRDFDVKATTVNGTTVGPFHGSLKFPGVGPFVGASFRF
jgi:hypothetical protein